MTGAVQGENPYIGPRPFQRSEKDRFFGREREARALLSLVVSERLVLFYAQSGAGKSSLINARLAPGLEERGFAVLPIGRVSGHAVNGVQAANIYVYNLLISLESSDTARPIPPDLPQQTLAGYLAAMPTEDVGPVSEIDEPGQAIESGFQPLVLIIDQFEEIFTTQLHAWKQRASFFEQLSAALQADPNLWVVLAMREDYIAALDPYARLLPNHLRARYYMERMGYESALDAVTRPVERIRPFDLDAAEQLVNNLRLVSFGKDESGQVHFVSGEYIEPVQLQVVCYQLWEQLRSRPGERITAIDLSELARGADLAQFISRALADLYEQALARTLRQPGIRTSERELREWFSHEMITEGGTRGFVFQGDEKTGSLPNSVVRLLENQFILRSEIRAAGKWVELVHDRFVSPILQANQAWFAFHSSPISTDAAAWLRANRDPACLYEGRQLEMALAQLASDEREFGEKEKIFLQASRQAVDRKQAVRQKRVASLVTGLVILFALLAVFGLYSATRATLNATSARASSTQSAYALQTAQASSVQALVQQSYAEDARSEAIRQSTLASEAQLRAEAEAKITRSGQMAALSAYYLETRRDVARILSVEAYNSYNGWEAQKALLSGLQRGSDVRIARESGPLSNGMDIWAVAVSPDGGLVAAGDTNGGVTLWDVARGAQANIQPPEKFRQTQLIYAVAFDPSGDILAAAGKDSQVGLWNRASGDVTTISIGADNWITSLAFQPGGDLLAAARLDGRVTLIDYRLGRLRGDLTNVTRGAWGLAWSPDGQKLAVGFSDGSIKVWEITSQLNPQELKGHDAVVRGLAWSPDGRYLYSGGRDNRLLQWDIAAGQSIRESRPEETGKILALALSRDGQTLVTSSADQVNPITIWDVDTLRLVGTLSGHNNWVMSVAFSPGGERFVTGGVDESLFIWKVETQQPLSQVVNDTRGTPFSALGLDTSNRWVAFAAGNELTVLSEGGGKLPASLLGGEVKIALIPGKQMAAAVGQPDGSIFLQDLITAEVLQVKIDPLPGAVLAVASNASGSSLAAAYCLEVSPENSCNESAIRILDLATGRPAAGAGDLRRPGQVTSLAFNPDDDLLVSGSSDGAILFLSLSGKDPATLPLLQNSSSGVDSLAFSTDGTLLAAGQSSGEIGLWEAVGYRQIGTLSGPERVPVTGLSFRKAASGKLVLLSASRSGFLREWDVDFSSWAQRACSLAGRSLSTDEWAQLFPNGTQYSETCKN